MNNLDKQYQSLLQDILDNGVEKKDRTGTGTKSIFGYQIRHDMQSGFPLLTTKKMAWKTMVTELLWFLRGDTNIKFLVDNNCHIWDGDAYKNYSDQVEPWEPHLDMDMFINKIKTDDEFAQKFGSLGKIYGSQWRKWDVPKILTIEKGKIEKSIGTEWGSWERNPIDQIVNLINELKTNPDSRRMLVSAWNVSDVENGTMVLPPCHYGFQVYTRELSQIERREIAKNKLNQTEWADVILLAHYKETYDKYNIPTRAISLMWNQRSVDTFLGLPFNIASYGLLLEIIAKTVNMVPDELIGNLGDVHLYSNHIEQAKEQLTREPFKLPKLNINTEFWPTENGLCGEGPLDAIKVFESFKDDNFCKCLLEEDLQLYDYQSHPAIKAPLSN